ncbi:MAG: glycosyl hydrolase 53 family protein [Chitinophagaceae bacterium]|nr:glycosyl hydrolase 53 family protein [Chitinophagaceae bacterium]
MKSNLKYYNLIVILFLMTSCSKSNDSTNTTPVIPTTKTLEIKGADISYLPEIRQSSIQFYNAIGQAEDMLTTLKNAGVNVIRLRLWKNPTDATSSFQTVKNLSTEIKALGMKTLITVHYSDSWADPGKQTKPAQWQSLNFTQLQDSVYIYTKKIMQEMNPDYIQIGNEINGGLLWPEGSASNNSQMKLLLQKGITAVREINTSTKIIIHYAGFSNASNFYNSISTLDYDVIGLSYYPLWHGKDVNALKQTMINLSDTYNKKIFIAETSYPFTHSWNDWTNNIIGSDAQILPEFAATPFGQRGFLNKIKEILTEVPKGIGFCYWGAEWVSYKGNQATNGSTWENQAFWDFSNYALPVLDVYK